MITAVDTSVLLDVFGADRKFGPAAKELLRRCLSEGRVVACAPVFAEITWAFGDSALATAALMRLPIEFDDCDAATACMAGEIFREYRRRGGKRDRIIADFLIGAHATRRADRLLTRDRGFHQSYFEGLRVLEPAAS